MENNQVWRTARAATIDTKAFSDRERKKRRNDALLYRIWWLRSNTATRLAVFGGSLRTLPAVFVRL